MLYISTTSILIITFHCQKPSQIYTRRQNHEEPTDLWRQISLPLILQIFIDNQLSMEVYDEFTFKSCQNHLHKKCKNFTINKKFTGCNETDKNFYKGVKGTFDQSSVNCPKDTDCPG